MDAEIFMAGASLAYMRPEAPDCPPGIAGRPEIFSPFGPDALPEDISSALRSADEAALREELAAALPGFKARRVPSGVKMALAAVTRACRAAGLASPLELASQRCALHIGTGTGAAENTLNFINGLLVDGPRLASPTLFSHSVSNTFAGMLAATLGLRGPAVTCSQEGLSLYGAFLSAWLDLAAGDADVALVGAVEESHPVLEKVRSVNAYTAKEGACAAFFLLSRRNGPRRARIFMPVLRNESLAASGETGKCDPAGTGQAVGCGLKGCCRQYEITGSALWPWLPAAQAVSLAMGWAMLRDAPWSGHVRILCGEPPADFRPGCLIRLENHGFSTSQGPDR